MVLVGLVALGAVGNLFFLALSALTWRRGRAEVAGAGYWFSGFATFTAGLALVALRHRVPDLLSILLANLLLLAGIAVKIVGLYRYLDLPRLGLKRLLSLYILCTGALLLYFLEADPSVRARMLVISVSGAGLGYLGAYCLFFRVPGELRAGTAAAGVAYAVFALLFSYRIKLALAWNDAEEWIRTTNARETAVIGAAVLTIAVLAVAEMVMVHGKLELSLRAAARELEEKNRALADEVERRSRAERELQAINRELGSTQHEIMITLSEVVEFRSKETALHVARVGEYARLLAAAVGVDPDTARMIGEAAPMHDIGKISVPDDILNKTSSLSAQELTLIRNHTVVGYRLLGKSERPLIKMAAGIAWEHHEQWDGSGYPEGKRGEDISLPGRIVCLCDVYDALAVARPYKQPWELPRILEYVRAGRETIFDPALVDAFFLNLDDFLRISEALKDA